MAEIPVEHKEKSGLPWWLIPLLLLLLIPILFFGLRGCSDRAGVVDNTNGNANRTVVTTMNANNAVVVNNANNLNAGNAAAVFNEEQRIKEANERARLAMEKVYPNGTPQQVVEALNLSIVNFAKGSAEVPASDQGLLKQAAEMLKKAPADTRIEVDGHTDNDGEAAANQKLSERRAESVRAELVKLGVPAGYFSTKGYGETQPKATNDTPEGRFQNRRIEYKVSTGGVTEKVTSNGNSK